MPQAVVDNDGDSPPTGAVGKVCFDQLNPFTVLYTSKKYAPSGHPLVEQGAISRYHQRN